MAERNPADLAREALKLLAQRRLPPTPAHYQAAYEEVAGLVPQVAFPQTPLRRIASVLPTQTHQQKRIGELFHQAVESQDWVALQSAIAAFANLDVGDSHVAWPSSLPAASVLVESLPENLARQLSRAVESTMTALASEDSRLRDIGEQLQRYLNSDPASVVHLERLLNDYSYQLFFTAEDQLQRQQRTRDLLRMVLHHLAALSEHDSVLAHRAAQLQSSMNGPSWSLEHLDSIQTQLKNLLLHHLQLQGEREHAHTRLKELLSTYTEHLLGLSHNSERHAQALQNCASQIHNTQDFEALAHAFESLVTSGKALATESHIAHAQIQDLREQVNTQAQQVDALTSQLQQLEDSTRHDPVTRALNYLGFTELLHSEAHRNQRHQQYSSVATLEIDDWETLPAIAGPQASEAALLHISRLIRSSLRPQDTLGHTAPQQLTILFPCTQPAEANQALTRLQAKLQSQALIHNNQLVPLRFHAGVVLALPHETPVDTLDRASMACDQAQRMGGAHVVLA